MNNKLGLLIGVVILGIAIMGLIGSIKIPQNSVSISKSNLINPDFKPYTDIQPSNFIGSPNSLIKVYFDNGLIKIPYPSGNGMMITHSSNTGSMRPAIPDYSALILITPTLENIQVGDIVAFVCANATKGRNYSWITHRIIGINGNNYLTKGDNNPYDDEITFDCDVKFEDIKAKVVGVFW